MGGCVTPIEADTSVKIIEPTKNKTPGHMLSNNALCLRSMHSTCYYFSTGRKFQIYGVIHAHTQTDCSYAKSITWQYTISLPIHWEAQYSTWVVRSTDNLGVLWIAVVYTSTCKSQNIPLC